MNKAYIKENWGELCNTDKLVDDMMSLLSEYNHRNTEHGVCKVLEEFFINKEPFIRLIAASPNYKGDLRIITKEKFKRENVENDIYYFVDDFINNPDMISCIVNFEDSNGKTFFDYFHTGTTKMTARQAAQAEDLVHSGPMSAFNEFTFATKETQQNADAFKSFMIYFKHCFDKNIKEDLTYEDNMCKFTLANGMKTSRAFNKVCTATGVNKWEKYNKEFAKYADMVSGNERELYFVMSLNPLDYLTMSFGKSWASCHTIDKENIREMPCGYSGEFCNGTMSYMLDKSSMITYVLDSISGDIHKIGKIYRNMFHYENNCFIQGRIYPQGNDGSTDLYKMFRGLVQNEFTGLLGLEENKWKCRPVDEYEDAITSGRHYPDYTQFDDCRYFYVKGTENVKINIGHTGICPHCGEETYHSDELSHDDCRPMVPINDVTVNHEDVMHNVAGDVMSFFDFTAAANV